MKDMKKNKTHSKSKIFMTFERYNWWHNSIICQLFCDETTVQKIPWTQIFAGGVIFKSFV